jgi:hypothetical protein
MLAAPLYSTAIGHRCYWTSSECDAIALQTIKIRPYGSWELRRSYVTNINVHWYLYRQDHHRSVSTFGSWLSQVQSLIVWALAVIIIVHHHPSTTLSLPFMVNAFFCHLGNFIQVYVFKIIRSPRATNTTKNTSLFNIERHGHWSFRSVSATPRSWCKTHPFICDCSCSSGSQSDRYSETVPLRSLSDTESAYPRMEMSGEPDLDLDNHC